jgi:hypothetical protein
MKWRWSDLNAGSIAALSNIGGWFNRVLNPGAGPRLWLYKGIQTLVARIALIPDLMNAQYRVSTPELVFARQKIVLVRRRRNTEEIRR